MLDASSKLTLQEQAMERLRREIAAGLYVPGSRVPSERVLGERYGVSRITIKLALEELVRQGTLEAIPRKGRFVTEQAATPPKPQFASALLAGPGLRRMRKRLRFGVLGELPSLQGEWQQVLHRLEQRHPHIELELVSCTSRPNDEASWASYDLLLTDAGTFAKARDQGWLLGPEEHGGAPLPRAAFFDGLAAAATAGNELRGVPMASAVACQAYRQADFRRVAQLDPVGAPFETLDRLATATQTGEPPMIACDVWLGTLLLMTGAGGRRIDFREFLSTAERALLHRFAPYFRNAKLFVQEADHVQHGAAAFAEGASLLRWQNSLHLQIQCRRRGLAVGILPPPLAANGALDGTCFIAAASTFTPFPEEALQVLRLLAESETQRIFSTAGHLVANRQAMQHFRHPLFGQDAASQFSACLECAALKTIKPPLDFTFVLQVVNHETVAWQSGCFDTGELARRIRRRAQLMMQAIEAGRFRRQPNEEVEPCVV